MGKRSGVTKSGRVMNPADRERKQQRAKELKRNKKQRTMVRQAIVKSRNPEELIEQMSRLDDQEFDPERELSLNVIQEKRHKMRGSFFQIINLARQEKEEKRVKNLEKMLYEYEVERSKKEENFRAQMFSVNANFEEIPLPIGVPGAPDAAKTPFTPGLIGPQEPQLALKGGILKKPSAVAKKHKYPPGPPPGLPPPLSDNEEDEEEQEGRESREDGERRRRVRFGGESVHRRRGDDDEDDREEDEEDYAPVEIPESMLAVEKEPPPQQQPVYSRAAPPVMPPASMGRPLPPGMAPLPPGYPPGFYPPNMPPEMHAQAMRTGRMPIPPQQQPGMMAGGNNANQTFQQPQQSKTGLINYASEPYPSAVISAAPQVVKPTVDVTSSGSTETVTISAAPQMRNIKREATRFVPTAVKIQRPVMSQPSAIGPKIPTSSIAGPTRIVPQKTMKKSTISSQQSKTADEACDEFLRELEGLL